MKVYVHYDYSGAIHALIAVNAPADRIANASARARSFRR